MLSRKQSYEKSPLGTDCMRSQSTHVVPCQTTAAHRRILDLRDSPWVDGPGRTILDTASMIDPDRYEIVVGAFFGNTHGEHVYLSEAVQRGLQVCPIAETRALDISVLKNIIAWCKANRIDIHTHDFRSDLYGLAAARWLRIPAVSTCHGWISNDKKGAIYTRLDKLLRFFDHVIAVSGRMQRELIRHGVRENKTTRIQNALVVEQYHPDRRDTSVRLEWDIPTDHKIIAKIGRLSQEKRQDLFLQAAADILKKHPKTHFVLIGIGPEQAALEALSLELGIQDHVIFAGFRNDMQAVYNSIDMVVQCSITEGMPNVILEALLMRVPVVATDVGGTSEIVEHEISGILIPPNDRFALITGIDRYLANPAAFDAWIDAGERQVRDRFSHSLRVRRIMDVYDSVLLERS